MILRLLEVRNFRCFEALDVHFAASSQFIVGENAAGKSALLGAIAKALGRDAAADLSDFHDSAQTIELVATLGGFDLSDQGTFASELKFNGPPTLRIGFRATWDPTERETEVEVGFPDLGWKRATREQREALPLLWYPAWRDPIKLLQVEGAKSVLAQLLASMNLDAAVDDAVNGIAQALQKISSTAEVASLLGEARATLADLIPGVEGNAFSLASENATSRSLLREFDLLLAHSGPALPIGRQSNGLAHLSLFVFALQKMRQTPKALLMVDEPEISLHPQAQRALVGALKALPNQSIVATHSSNILDRADPRTIVRLERTQATVQAKQAASMSDAEALHLARFASPLTTEACFARKVVLVEGYSDRLFLMQVSRRLGRNLDAEGVSLISLDGGSSIGSLLSLLGKPGLGIALVGLCDEDKEASWIKEVSMSGVPVSDRASLKAAGFHICVRDLEQESIRSIGIAGIQAMIASAGEEVVFGKFAAQPQQKGQPLDEQLRKFLHGANVRWALPLADAMDLKSLPGPINDIFLSI